MKRDKKILLLAIALLLVLTVIGCGTTEPTTTPTGAESIATAQVVIEEIGPEPTDAPPVPKPTAECNLPEPQYEWRPYDTSYTIVIDGEVAGTVFVQSDGSAKMTTSVLKPDAETIPEQVFPNNSLIPLPEGSELQSSLYVCADILWIKGDPPLPKPDQFENMCFFPSDNDWEPRGRIFVDLDEKSGLAVMTIMVNPDGTATVSRVVEEGKEPEVEVFEPNIFSIPVSDEKAFWLCNDELWEEVEDGKGG